MEKSPVLEGLQKRVSHPRLSEPAPSREELDECYLAAFRSPDHAWLRPWRFIECSGDERSKLGALIAGAVQLESPETPEAALNKIQDGPLRAPLVIVCYAQLTEHSKVPPLEQIIATGCAANNLITSLSAQGYGAVWRTGDQAYLPEVHSALNLCQKTAPIVGFIYVGTPAGPDKEIPVFDMHSFVCDLSEHLKKEA